MVAVIIAVTKFMDGAWLILILLPVMVVVLLRLNRQYAREAQELDSDVPAAIKAPILRRHVVLVFVDRLDMATARAIQYARTLTPDDLRVVHFAVDDRVAHELADEWRRLGLLRVPLDIVACPDRRLTRAAVQHVARELADGQTEVSVLLPDRRYRGLWHRVLHDRTAEAFLADLSRLPHANVTTVPFQFDGPTPDAEAEAAIFRSMIEPDVDAPAVVNGRAPRQDLSVITKIAHARWRDRVVVQGQVRSLRIVSQHDSPTLELVITDGTGALSLIFLGRREVAGIDVGHPPGGVRRRRDLPEPPGHAEPDLPAPRAVAATRHGPRRGEGRALPNPRSGSVAAKRVIDGAPTRDTRHRPRSRGL